jgi:hypothetical protein
MILLAPKIWAIQGSHKTQKSDFPEDYISVSYGGQCLKSKCTAVASVK